jgi:hypothetical protein
MTSGLRRPPSGDWQSDYTVCGFHRHCGLGRILARNYPSPCGLVTLAAFRAFFMLPGMHRLVSG